MNIMKIIDTKFPEAKIIIPEVYEDHRGFFKETYNIKKFTNEQIPYINWVQDGISYSENKFTLRGMHKQKFMSKLVGVLSGQVFDVIVDMRENSPTYKQWEGFYLSAVNHKQLLVPEGFAHGFMTLTDKVVFSYKMSVLHNTYDEKAYKWNSPGFQINWPKHDKIIISQKDENAEEVL